MSKTEIIKELNFLDDIDALEDEYIAKYGISAFNISNWNSSQEFKSKIIKDLSMQNDFDCLDYIFSYEQSEQKGSVILSKLGYSENKATLFTHSGSSSIINVINLLKKIGIKKLIVLCPVYFTVIHCCEMFGLDYELIYINRDVNYIFNKNEFVGIGDVSYAYWITNPIYCTSVYYTSNQIEFFKTICQTNYVVFDESLCLLEYLITPKINSKYVIGLISPHKSICMNGTKFSLVTTDIRFQDFLDAWSDVLCGCLCCSNEIAIKHFLSDSYIAYKNVFDKMIKKQFMELTTLLDYYPYVSYDKYAEGYLISLFFKRIKPNKGLELEFNRDILNKTGVRFIPGIRNHFSDSMGFCFRVNLSVLSESSIFYVKRILNYLTEY